MENLTYSKSAPSKTIVNCVQWVSKGNARAEALRPGYIAGFEHFFKDSPSPLSEFLIGLTGNNRLETIAWLHQQAEKLGLHQCITEVVLEMRRTFRERINGICANGTPCDEYDITKATTNLKSNLMQAWTSSVTEGISVDKPYRSGLLDVVESRNISNFIPISSFLFSKTVEKMPFEFQNARVIIFPALPLALEEWQGNPARLIAFKKETIVSVKHH
jgi:hypothetical protein